jgi:L-asparaginase II
VLARSVRSGLPEEHHEGAVAAVVGDTVVAVWGDAHEPLFYRSAVKAFQATVSQECGADLPPEHLAVACSSHGGHPAHLAIVAGMLAGAGLDESALRCPPSWPLGPAAERRLRDAGYREPRRIYHNCSGKHAAMLRACVARGWPIDSYTHPDHPLQRIVIDLVADVTGVPSQPVGIDGCGLPTLRGSVAGLARAFSVLTTEPRYAAAAAAMSRFPALTGDNLRPDGALGAWWGGPVKVGAAGLIGAGRNGLGIAAKARDGSAQAAVVGLLEASRLLGALSPAMERGLQDTARPAVLGGGAPVGATEPHLGTPLGIGPG